MRIPFPNSIPRGPLLVFLTVVLLVQLIEGTDPVFAFLMLIAQLAAAEAFNLLGGMTRMAGAFCLFAIMPNVTVPELTHLLLGQPGDYNLQHPITTAGVCALFFMSMMTAGWLVSLARPAIPYVDRISFSMLELRIISVLACVFMVGITLAVIRDGGHVEDGTLLAALNHFGGMLMIISIMLATYVRLADTNGASAMSWYVALLLTVGIMPGVLGASKEGMLLPVFCWFVVVAASGHRFSRVGALVLFGLAFLLWTFVYPFSQNARFQVREAESVSDKMDFVLQYISDPSQFPDSISSFDESSEFGTDTSRVNIVQRYSLLKPNDMLIDADLRSGYNSIDRYLPVLFMIIPHALWPDRPQPMLSNELGHKAGFKMGETDFSTGISIGSPAMFFDVGGWMALVVYSLICLTGFFYVTIRLVGTSNKNIWALVPIGSEALLAGAASPGSMFVLIISYLGVFVMLVMVLKTVSYISKFLISRPIPV